MSDKKEKKVTPTRAPSLEERMNFVRTEFIKEKESYLLSVAVERELDDAQEVEEYFRTLISEAIDENEKFSQSHSVWFEEVALFVQAEMAQQEIMEISEKADVKLYKEGIAAVANDIPPAARQGQYTVYSFNYTADNAYEANSLVKALLGAYNHLCAAGGCARPFVDFPGGDIIQVKVRGIKPEYR